MPDSKPENHHCTVERDHAEHAIAPCRTNDDKEHHYLDYAEPHVYIAPPAAYGEILVHGVEGKECSGEAKHAQQWDTACPLVSYGKYDELIRYDGKTEHQGHGEEGCEAHHLTEYSALAHNGVLGSGVSSLNHDGLGYLPDSVGDKR